MAYETYNVATGKYYRVDDYGNRTEIDGPGGEPVSTGFVQTKETVLEPGTASAYQLTPTDDLDPEVKTAMQEHYAALGVDAPLGVQSDPVATSYEPWFDPNQAHVEPVAGGVSYLDEALGGPTENVPTYGGGSLFGMDPTGGAYSDAPSSLDPMDPVPGVSYPQYDPRSELAQQWYGEGQTQSDFSLAMADLESDQAHAGNFYDGGFHETPYSESAQSPPGFNLFGWRVDIGDPGDDTLGALLDPLVPGDQDTIGDFFPNNPFEGFGSNLMLMLALASRED